MAFELRTRTSRVARGVESSVLLALVIFILALLPRFLNLDVFVGPDEFYWVSGSNQFTEALATGDLAKTYHAGQPGVTLMWVETAGSWLRHAAGVVAGTSDWSAAVSAEQTMAALAAYRLVAAVANATLVAVIAMLVRSLFGTGAGWLTGFLLAFDPFLLTESRVVRTEGLMAGITTVALLSLILYWRKRQPRYVVLSGFLTGLALLSKITALALLPVGGLVVGCASYAKASGGGRRRWGAPALLLAVWIATTVLTVVALWPALWVTPGDVSRQMLDFTSLRAVEGDERTKSFLFGNSYEDPGALFYPVVLVYRTSPLLWLGIVALVVSLWLWRRRARQEKAALAAMLLYLAAYLALITVSKIKYDRYIVPMLPTLLIMSAVGMVSLWTWCQARVPRIGSFAAPATCAVLALQVALALPYHPYYYSYYNPLLGGAPGAANVLPVGVGYEGTEKAAIYLNSLPEPEKIRLATAVSSKLKPIFKGQTIPMANQEGAWFLADYTFIYISQLQRGKHDDELIAYLKRKPLVYSFQLAGLDYGWVYRGPGAQYFGGDTKLEGRATLHAFDLSANRIGAGQVLSTTVYFRNEGQREGDRFYVRLVDPDGYVWADSSVRPRVGFEEAFRTRLAIVEGEAALKLPVGMPPGEYVLKMGYADSATGQPIGEFVLPEGNDSVLVELPAAFPPPDTIRPSHPATLLIQDEVQLLGYDLAAESVPAGSAVWLTLYWHALADVSHDYVIGVQLLDGAGTEVAYWLGRPTMNRYPTTEWRSGQLVQDAWRLLLPAGISSGRYELQATVYDAATTASVAATHLGPLVVDGE